MTTTTAPADARSHHRPSHLIITASTVSLVVSVAAIAITFGAERGVSLQRLKALDDARTDHEMRLRQLEHDRTRVAAMANQVEYIAQEMSRLREQLAQPR